MKALAIAAALGVCSAPAIALAQGTTTTTGDVQNRPFMLAEGAQITDVVDAFDSSGSGTNWSFRVTAGYIRTLERGTIQRERSTLTAPRDAMGNPVFDDSGITRFDNVANYNRLTQTLLVNAQLAVFRDLAITFGLPIILSDTRELESSNASTADMNQRLRDGYSLMGMPTQLFNVPFRSPERSGIDQIYIGAMWNILNQARDPHLPTWLLRFEWRPPVGPVLRPCDATGGSTYCPQENAPRPDMFDPAESTNINMTPEQIRRAAGPQDPGISRGVHGLYLQTVMSRRIWYLEPYIGLDALLELPLSDITAFRYGATPYGQLATIPPIRGSLLAGTEIVPWENRETWQRFVIDVRVRAEYYSQGRDYSPLYDALGASQSVPLTAPSYSVTDLARGDTSRPINFAGTTTVQSHGRLTAQLGLSIQAAKFLRFSLGTALTYITPHLITATDACNPNEQPGGSSPLRGGCVGNAAPDPLHRPVIDAPGQRFGVTDNYSWDLWINVSFSPRF